MNRTITKVACQGVEGAYSNLCAQAKYPGAEIINFKTFGEVIEAVASGAADCGVLPIENSTAGSVTETCRLLERSGLYIVDGASIAVNHCLLGKKGAKLEDIAVVKSHWQALAQCGEWMAKRGVNSIAAANTAIACRELAAGGDKAEAVIAGRQCSELYGLEILMENIQDYRINYTRFVTVAREPNFPRNANTVSIIAQIPNVPNSLYRMMTVFSDYGVNLKSIHSINIPNTRFEVQFFIDIEGSVYDEKIREMLEKLGQDRKVTLLGAYNDAFIE